MNYSLYGDCWKGTIGKNAFFCCEFHPLFFLSVIYTLHLGRCYRDRLGLCAFLLAVCKSGYTRLLFSDRCRAFFSRLGELFFISSWTIVGFPRNIRRLLTS